MPRKSRICSSYFEMLFYSAEKRRALLNQFSVPSIVPSLSEMLLQDIREINLTAEAGEFAFPVLVANWQFDLDVTPSTAFDLHAYTRLTFLYVRNQRAPAVLRAAGRVRPNRGVVSGWATAVIFRVGCPFAGSHVP